MWKWSISSETSYHLQAAVIVYRSASSQAVNLISPCPNWTHRICGKHKKISLAFVHINWS